MPANLENSAVATVLEKGSFHSNPRERQCQTHKEKNAMLAIQMCLKTRPLLLPYDKVTLHTALLLLRFRVISPVAFHCFAEKKFYVWV